VEEQIKQQRSSARFRRDLIFVNIGKAKKEFLQKQKSYQLYQMIGVPA
jgi:hypothetical protein